MNEISVFSNRIYSVDGEREKGGMGERGNGKTKRVLLPLSLSPFLPLSLSPFLPLILLILFAGCGGEPASDGMPEHDMAEHEHNALTAPAEGSKAAVVLDADATQQYTCSMHPHVIADEPGSCPICGMDLTPIRQSTTAEGIVEIDPVTIQNIGVRTAPVTIESLNRTIRTTGRFEMDEQGAYTVSLKVGGWVEALHVDYEGALARMGEPLLELYSPELVSAQEEYLLALRNARRLAGGPAAQDARRLLDAARRRLLYWDLTNEQISRLETTGEPFRTLTFYAPAAGEVMNKNVVAGQRVAAGQALMDIVDISKIWLIADVYEQDMGWIKEGTPARIELPYQPGETWTGRVDHIYLMMNLEARSARARIVLPAGRQSPLKPGMYATVYLEGEETGPSPVVPEEAVIRTGEQVLVILSLGGGRFQPREIQTGIQAEGMVQVLAGLAEDDLIVTSAQFLIDSEARLKGAVGAMLGNHDHGAMQDDATEADAGHAH